MNIGKSSYKIAWCTTCFSALISFSDLALASAFQTWEQTAIGAGLAHADMAAGAYDPSTAYYNPAGMSRLDTPQMSTGSIWVSEITDISNIELIDRNTNQVVKVVGNTESVFDAVAPNFYVVYPFNDLPFEPRFGLSINGPFGGATYYHDTLLENYAAKTSLKAILINPALSFSLSEKLSFGAGMDIQQLRTDITAVPSAFLAYTDLQSEAKTWGLGWNLGVLYEFTEETRVGATYRSKIDYEQNGVLYQSVVLPPDVALTYGYDSYMDITLPAITTLGFYHDLEEDFSVMATAAYVQWDVIEELEVYVPELNNNGLIGPYFTTPVNFKNTWFFSVGADYDLTDKWIVRAGMYYDQTPTNDEDRELRAPDSDRYTFTTGLGYQFTEYLRVDAAYQFIFTPAVDFENVAVQTDPGVNSENFQGTASSIANVWGVQLTYDFCCNRL